MSVAFNGVVLVAPGVASFIDDSTSSAAPVASGNALAILGEAERGETGRAVLFTDPATMRAYYGNASVDSPLVWGITRAMNAGALRVYGVRVGSATQATTSLVSSSDGSSAIEVSADEWGLTGNSWSLAVSKNSGNPKNKDLKLTLHDGRIYTATNVGQNVLQIEYFTDSLTVAPTIAIGTNGSATNLYLTVNGVSSQTAIIPLAEYDTITKLISKINQYYTQSTPAVAGSAAVPAGTGGALPISTLKRVGVIEATGQLQLTLVDSANANAKIVTVNYSSTSSLAEFAANIQTAIRAASPVGANATTSATVTYDQLAGFSLSTGSGAKFSGIAVANAAALPTTAQLNAGQGGSSVNSTLLASCFPRLSYETFPHVAISGGAAADKTLESAGGFVSTSITATIKNTVSWVSAIPRSTWNPALGTNPTYTAVATGGSANAWTGTLTTSGGATVTFASGDVITATHTATSGGAVSTVDLTVTAAVSSATSVNISYAGTSSLASGTLTYETILVTRPTQASVVNPVLGTNPTYTAVATGGSANAWTGTLTASGSATMTLGIGDVITATHTATSGGAVSTVALTVTAAVSSATSVSISYAGTSSLASGTLAISSMFVTRAKQVALPYSPTFSGDTFGGTGSNSVVTKWNAALATLPSSAWSAGGIGTGGVSVSYAPTTGYTFSSTYSSYPGNTVVFGSVSGAASNDIARFSLSGINASSFPVSSGAIAVASTAASTYVGNYGQNLVNTAFIPEIAAIPAQASSGWKASLASGITDTTFASIKLDRLETTYVPTSAQISAQYASFVGYIADELVNSVLTPTLTVFPETSSNVIVGNLAIGQVVVGDGVISGTTITAFQSGATGKGGKYTLSISNSSGSASDPKSYTATSAALSKLNLSANTNAIVDALNGPLLGSLVTASATASASSILDKTYVFSGATEASVSPLHWDTALASLQSLDDVEIIVPMTSSSSIQASVLSHCLSMSSATGKRERFMVVGGDKNLSVEAVKSLASKFADKRAVVVWPGIKDYDDKNQLLTWSPVYLAATVGGMLAAQSDVAQPLTGKPIAVRGLETTARLADLDDLVSNGVLAVRYDSNRGYSITQSLTTWTGDTRYARREISTMRAADATMKLIRNSVQGFIGSKLSDRAIEQIKNRVNQALEQASTSGLIVGTPSNPAFKDLIVRNVGDAIYVDVSISPAIPINYLLITAHIL